MDLFCGTSGYSYDPWRGPFYPADLKKDAMLRFYGTRLNAVEINNTFYQMPKADVLARWAGEVPAGFRFAIKAPQRMTHIKKLKDCGDLVAHFLTTVATLGERVGPLLFQLPPWMKKDLALLGDFLALVPSERRPVMEFRHESWNDVEVLDALRARGAVLCAADHEEAAAPVAIQPTADWGYLRLRRCDYTDADLQAWARRVRAQGWRAAYVFFKHEDAGIGPDFALRFGQAFAALG